MKLMLGVSILAAVLVVGAVGASVDRDQPDKRLLLDGMVNVIHAVVDPMAHILIESVHALVSEFDHLVHGDVDLQTVVCKMPVETTGTPEEKMNACIDNCLSNANMYLEQAANSSEQACPIACQYALDHPTHYTC